MSNETIPPALVAEGARPKLGSDSNGNQVEDTSVSLEESFESGFDDGLIGSSRGTGTGSVSGSTIGSPSLASLDEPAALAEPTEEERLAWQQEMLKIEEETATLRLVLQAKVRRATDLKRKLGITQMDEIKADVNTALKTIQESSAYNKTASTLQVVSEKTNAAITSAVEAFRGAVNENVENPGPAKVSNTILRDATDKLSSAASATGTYVSRTVETVMSNPSVKAAGATVNSTWSKLKAQVVGSPDPPEPQQPDFVGEVVGKEPTSQ